MRKIRTTVVTAVLTAVGLLTTPAAALAADDVPARPGMGTCTDRVFGGTFLCGGNYGEGKAFYKFSNGTEEIFVIGTDHAVWTRWTVVGGELSRWTTLGGRSEIGPIVTNRGRDAVSVTIRDSQGTAWARDRSTAGRWGDWRRVSGSAPSEPVA
ncbi:hypothetical protein [Krasilnikovia cinnamomea]|uniref:hypothetical protein n=1 Tax=Krasilnikovia cinnamomea TaxID=349313 RepID=UPI00102B1EE0|nr:hypothetical protein [Krasilnikovia cinnamomea]